MNNVTQAKRGRPRKESLVQTESKGWLAIDLTKPINETEKKL